MVFKGGDRVRLKDDDSDKTWIVYSVFWEMNEALIMGFGENTTCHRLVNPAEIVLVDQHADIKQAIREVLLSDEFLAAFAAAFVNAPMPSTIQPAVLSTQIERSIAQEAFEWFKSDDIAIAPITGSESEAYYLDKMKKGESK